MSHILSQSISVKIINSSNINGGDVIFSDPFEYNFYTHGFDMWLENKILCIYYYKMNKCRLTSTKLKVIYDGFKHLYDKTKLK